MDKAGSSGRSAGPAGRRRMAAAGLAQARRRRFDIAGEEERLPRRVAADIVDFVSRGQTLEPLQAARPNSRRRDSAFAAAPSRRADLACVRGGRLVFSGAVFRVAPGRLLAVIGPNGSGKSSLLRVLAGLLAPRAGTLSLRGRAARTSRSRTISAMPTR